MSCTTNETDRILVIGDSWASAREADTGRDLGWSVCMNLPDGMRQGVSGSTAEQWSVDFDGRLTRAQGTKADTVIISLFGNDARGFISDRMITVPEIAAGLRHMRIVMNAMLRPLTIVLLYADPFSGTNDLSSITIPLINGIIRRACRGLSVVYADIGMWLTRDHFDGRDIYPTRLGHAVIASRLRDLIDADTNKEME